MNLLDCSSPPLSSRAQRLLHELPPGLWPRVLRERYPEVLDALAARWDLPRDLEHYCDRLLFARASGGTALPFQAVIELGALKSHALQRVHRWRRSVWDEVLPA